MIGGGRRRFFEESHYIWHVIPSFYSAALFCSAKLEGLRKQKEREKASIFSCKSIVKHWIQNADLFEIAVLTLPCLRGKFALVMKTTQ